MAAPLTKTSHPGIFKRGGRYVVVYLVNGRQRREAVRTFEEARRLKAARLADRDRGEFQEQSRLPFKAYAEEWIERYQGNGRRGFTEDTRLDYKRDLERYAYPFFDKRLGRSLSGITPKDAASWIGWLCDERAQGRRLADRTIQRIASPVRSCLASARREGLIRHNPMDGAVLPHRPVIEEDEDMEAQAFTRAQLDAFLRVVHPAHRLMFRVLAATGVRWSELAALRWRDLDLDGSTPQVKVRRALGRRRRKGDAPTFKPPKSKYGRRSIPLEHRLVHELRERRREVRPDQDDLVFPARNGEPLRQENVRRRVLAPAAEEADAAWAGFHTFRHTCASMLFERGANAVQVQRWLGHHSPAFTLATYVHLLDAGVGDPLDLDAEIGGGDNEVTTQPPGIDRTQPKDAIREMAH